MWWVVAKERFRLWMIILATYLLVSGLAFAAGDGDSGHNFTSHWIGIVCVIIFLAAYALIIGEETLDLRKSKLIKRVIVKASVWEWLPINRCCKQKAQISEKMSGLYFEQCLSLVDVELSVFTSPN